MSSIPAPASALLEGQHIAEPRVRYGFCRRNVGDQHLVNAFETVLSTPMPEVELAAGQIAQQNALFLFCQRRGEADAGGGLADTALLIDYGNDFCHRPPAFRAEAQFLQQDYYSKPHLTFQAESEKNL